MNKRSTPLGFATFLIGTIMVTAFIVTTAIAVCTAWIQIWEKDASTPSSS